MASRTLSQSLEDYLEAIFHVSAQKGAARAKDIAARVGVKGASVTGALRSLAQKGLVNYAPYDVVTLTPRGKKAAEDIIRRHDALKNFFVTVLAVDEKEAEEVACRMEHFMSRTIMNRLVDFVDFVVTCPRSGPDWVESFRYYCKHGKVKNNCEKRFADFIQRLEERKSGKKRGPATATTLESPQSGRKEDSKS